MSATAAPPAITPEDLDAQLASAREKTSAAEVSLGEAVLDGEPTEKPQKAYDEALAAEQKIATAINIAKRRAADAAVAAEDDAKRQERIAIYRSAVEWLPLVEAYCRARVDLNTFETELSQNDPHPTISARKRSFITRRDPRVADLDDPFLRQLPKPPTLDAEGRRVVFPDPEQYPPDRIAGLIARATELAEAEERGETVATTPNDVDQQHAAKRKERRR
jgi:hypothetical protein